MKKAVKTGLVGAAIASAVVLAVPGTASAAYDNCAAGKVCLFDGPGGTGEVLQLDPVTIPQVPWEWNDRASSVWNRSSGYLCTWSDARSNGDNWIIEPGNKQELWALYDNAVSSIEVNEGFGCGG